MSLVRSWLQSTAIEVDVIISGDDVAEGKPSPAPYQLALQKLGVPAGEALAIEDSESGVRSATAAGVRVLRLSNVRTSDATSIGKLTEALDYLEP
jgi:HAD superfamily hydrolase (TIGR01509 family)